jgi:hypothetical protein
METTTTTNKLSFLGTVLVFAGISQTKDGEWITHDTTVITDRLRSAISNPWNWNFHWLSSAPHITWDIIQHNLHFPWYVSHVSSNPNITWDIVRSNPDWNWDYKLLSRNPMSKDKCFHTGFPDFQK